LDQDLTDQMWQERLHAAGAPEGIVAVAKQFLASWKPTELATLPAECRPPIMGNADDLGVYAFTLARYMRLHDHDERVERMAEFFACAQYRVSEVLALGAHRLPAPHFFSDGAQHRP
jgi:hypothetical protein